MLWPEGLTALRPPLDLGCGGVPPAPMFTPGPLGSEAVEPALVGVEVPEMVRWSWAISSTPRTSPAC